MCITAIGAYNRFNAKPAIGKQGDEKAVWNSQRKNKTPPTTK